MILHDLREPHGLLAALLLKARIIGGEDEVVGSAVGRHTIPGEQILGREFIDRHGLGRGLGLALARPLVDNRADNVDQKVRKIDILPLQPSQFAAPTR